MRNTKPNFLLEIVSLFCIIAGSLALSVFYLTSWAHALIFDTTTYLNVVAPLPKNSDVSKALSTYTIDTLFQDSNAEERIRAALPEQAAFLASPLAEQLQERSLHRTEQVIQSDQFSSLWVAANTLFHQKVLGIVRGGGILSQVQEKADSEEQTIQFDAGQLAQTIRDQLDSENRLFSNAQIEKFRSIAIPTFSKLEHIRQIVYWISQLAFMLLPLSLALLLFGIAISFSRQRAFLITGITLVVTMLITLITLQIIKTDLVNNITQSVYYNAANVVWENFVEDLQRMLWLTVLGGLTITVVAILAGPYRWTTNFRKTLGVPQSQKNKSISGINKVRMFFEKYKLWLILLGIFVAVVALFMMQNITIANVVVVLSSLLMYLAVLLLLFPRQRLV